MQDVFKIDGPDNGIFDIPDVCGQTNSFFKEILKTQARCDFENGGGWMIILRRMKDVPQQENFDRPWTDYEKGFGDLNTEFWYGLRNMHCLTEREEMELQVEVQQDDGTTQVWKYEYFEIDGPENNYTLHIGQAQGPSSGRDSMAYHNGMQFSTKDRDNDKHTNSNCANSYTGGGWWYKTCAHSVLTGGHANGNIYWLNGVGNSTYFSFVEMKLRPKRCKSETTSCTVVATVTPPTEPPVVTPCGVGWTRIAYLNMTDPALNCPSPWTEFTSGNKRVCFKSSSSGSQGTCDSVIYSNTRAGEYSQVCGRIIGYQNGIAFGFHGPRSLEAYYINGISVTHGQQPRKHIWSFVVGWSEVDDSGSCPCGSPRRPSPIPSYVANNYFCETGTLVNENNNQFFSNDSLWDGEGCGPGHSCECTLNSPPWFKMELSNATTDGIEVRNCVRWPTTESNIGIEVIELYVK